jgi:hypothetical protein
MGCNNCASWEAANVIDERLAQQKPSRSYYANALPSRIEQAGVDAVTLVAVIFRPSRLFRL